MRFVDWLNLFRSPSAVARENIRIRRGEYLRHSGPVAVMERLEDRCVLAAPTATDGSGGVHLNSMWMSSVSVFDADLDSLTVSLVSDVSHGSLLLNSDGSFVYTPDLNFVGEDSFSFQAHDGTEGSNVASFAITVGNGAPTAINGSDEWHMNSWAWGTLAASDPDYDSLTFSVVTEPEHGSLLLYAD